MKIARISRKLCALTAAAAAIAALSAPCYGTDKAELDALVRKGILSPEESLEISKSMAEVTYEPNDAVGPLHIFGGAQAQFMYTDLGCEQGAAVDADAQICKFLMRRVTLAFTTDKKKEYGAMFAFDFILPYNMSTTYLWKDIDLGKASGQLRMGYVKVNFCFEEYMSAFDLYCVERSMVSFYWCAPDNARRLGFGAFMTGAFWYGETPVEGLTYSFAATNSENYEPFCENIDGGANNAPSIWLGVQKVLNFEDGTKIMTGLNLGYGADANKSTPLGGSAIYGFNPFVSFERGDTRALLEYIATEVDKGISIGGNYRNTMPMGLTLSAEHKFDVGNGWKLAPAFRYTWLDTDGRGVLPSDTLRMSANVPGDAAYNAAQGFYVGLNWYILGNSLKLQAGYEFAQFSGAVGANMPHMLNANTVRSQMQVLF